jgi:EPS-associated MarR family transcriptional regulator|tara:strand:+ start:1192 stop:1560 length:369 start_codon:yes stop_codon:yes gene_type:complete
MLSEELELRTLKLLTENPHLTQRELASQLGISLGKAHYVLKALVNVGWIKLGNFRRSDNKLGYAYLLTPQGLVEKSAITRRFLLRKQGEYVQLRTEIEMLQREVGEDLSHVAGIAESSSRLN